MLPNTMLYQAIFTFIPTLLNMLEYALDAVVLRKCLCALNSASVPYAFILAAACASGFWSI